MNGSRYKILKHFYTLIFFPQFQTLLPLSKMPHITKRSVACMYFFLSICVYHRQSQAQTVSLSLCFSQEDQASLLPLVPKRLTPSGWPGVSNALTCARRSLMTFPASRGFMYNRATGLCSPHQWLEKSSAPGASPVQLEEGDLYLSCEICDDGFEIMAFGDAGDRACLKHVNSVLVTQPEASSMCTAWGAHLVTVKTRAKLQLVSEIAAVNTWVGFVFLRSQGIHVWTGDGEQVTEQQIQEVFNNGEPNDAKGNEDCGHLSIAYLKLNDEQCDGKYAFICEKYLPVLKT